MNDALGYAGGPRGVHDVEGMVGTKLFEFHLETLSFGEKLLKNNSVTNTGRIRIGIRIRHYDHLLNGR